MIRRTRKKKANYECTHQYFGKSGLLAKDLDYNLLRASMVLIFLAFGYQKWFAYEAKVLIPATVRRFYGCTLFSAFAARAGFWAVPNGCLADCYFWDFGTSDWEIFGAIGSTATFIMTVTTLAPLRGSQTPRAPVNAGSRDQGGDKHMPRSEHFDVLALGSGIGGKLIAWHMAESGRRTAVVERRWVGGSCPNIACMPSKNEIANAKVAHLARHGRDHGTVTGSVTVDMATVRRRKREMVERQITKHLQIYRTSGAELIMGSGRFLAPKTLEVKLNDGGTRVLVADKVFLNVGTHAAIPNVPGLQSCSTPYAR